MRELDQTLHNCKERLNFLVEYTSFTPREVRLNAEVFKWIERIDHVFEDHEKIMSEKKEQYQEGLKVRWSYFEATWFKWLFLISIFMMAQRALENFAKRP